MNQCCALFLRAPLIDSGQELLNAGCPRPCDDRAQGVEDMSLGRLDRFIRQLIKSRAAKMFRYSFGWAGFNHRRQPFTFSFPFHPRWPSLYFRDALKYERHYIPRVWFVNESYSPKSTT